MTHTYSSPSRTLMISLKPQRISFVLILIFITLLVSTNYLITKEIDVESVIIEDEGEKLHGIIAKPKGTHQLLPAIVFFHGFSATKEMYLPFVHEFAKAGFFVLAVDAIGHGRSSGNIADETATSKTGNIALNFLLDHSMVDPSKIGFVGHSRGGSIILDTTPSRFEVKSNVIIGNPLSDFDTQDVLVNQTSPQNLLAIVGQYDELISVEDTKSNFRSSINQSVEFNVVYGDFVQGNARKLMVFQTDHILEAINPEILAESISWTQMSLQITTNGNVVRPQDTSVQGFYSFLTVILVILFILIIISFYPHLDTKLIYENETSFSWKIHGIISFSGFIVGVPFINLLPGIFSGLFVIWYLFGYLIYSYYYSKVKEKTFLLSLREPIDLILMGSRSILYGGILFFSSFITLQLVFLVIHWDFRFVIPLLAALSVKRFVLIFLPLFLSGVLFFLTELRTLNIESNKLVSSQFLLDLISRSWFYFLVLAVYYIPLIIASEPLFSVIYGFLAFFLIGFIPVIFLVTLLTTYGRKYEVDRLVIAILCSGIVAWDLASTLPFG